ncbi:MAG: tRNA pseudouridine(38-40) synthase TruA [Gemmatimonadota bacterium]
MPLYLVGVTPDPECRFRLTVQYDGTYFFGWQLQAKGRTVQGEIEYALRGLTGARRPVVGAGRTDSGVHATGQVASVSLPTKWHARELQRALNATLPNDIWIEAVEVVPDDFHPRFTAQARSYRYQLGLSEMAFSPFHRPWCWALVQPVDLDLLQRGAGLILGEHSFKAFAKVGQESRGDRCTVTEAVFRPWEDLGVAFEITANRFLHHMVRYLMGTMVEIAWHRRPFEDLVELLSHGGTELVTSAPAPAQGLFLTKVHYPDQDSGLN